MRRTLLVALFVLLLTCLVVAPAAAQRRDPFQPATGSGQGVAPEAETAPAAEEPVVEAPPSGALTNTGGDPGDWIAVALALMALGTGALLVARLNAPVRIR